MMRRSVFPLLVVVIFVASYVSFTSAESTDHVLSDDTARTLKSTTDSIPADEEERAGRLTKIATNLKNLLRRNPTKMNEAKNNVDGAHNAFTKVNSIIGKGKTSTELTPAKMKKLETYAKSNSDDWWAMAYFVSSVLGIGLSVWFVYGTLFLGWRPYGMGGSPRAN